MADTLMFRKGPLSGLTNLPIKNGAISITTDEPGIYIDHNGKRSRVGDFITVANMAALADYKLNAPTEADRYNAHALYYVIDKDALARWDATTGDFKLINDRTSLVESLTALNGALTSLAGIVENQGKSIAANTTAIGNEKTRAEAAEAALSARIDDIVGGESGDSVASLRAALNKEITDRSEADAQILAKANTAQQEVDALEGVVSTLSGTVTTNKGLLDAEIERAKAAEGVNAKAASDEKDRAMAEEARLAGLITSNATTAANAIAAEEARAKAAENKIATFGTDGAVDGGALKVEIDRAIAKENAISEVANAAKSKADTNANSIANLVNADTALGQRITDEATARANADTALGNRIGALETASSTHALKTEVEAVAEDLADLTEVVGGHTSTLATVGQNINTLSQSIADEIADRGEEIARVEGLISKEVQDREKAINDEVANRNTAITSAVNSAKTELNQTISGNTANITKLNQDLSGEIARAKAAEEANAGKIKTNTENIASNLAAINKEIEDRKTAVSNEATERSNADAALGNSIDQLNKAVQQEVADRTQGDADTLASAKTYADEEIARRLEAANAMRYMGTVGDSVTSASDKRYVSLPTTGVEAGDTYVVVGTDFKLGGKVCKVGDLIVAINDQGTTASYPTDTTGWSHVPTGYDASLDQILSVSNKDASNNTLNGAKVALSSVMGAVERGSLTIVGNTNSNIKASLNSDNTILTINMEWEEWT